MNAPSSVLVVGASAAGLATAEALRRKGYQGGLTVLGAEPHLPYDRPPLSKQVLSGVWHPERARLRPQAALSALDAEFVLADPAVALDAAARTVHTASGRALRADAVVVATGLRPRTLPGQADLAGVHVLRTLDDALALRADLLASSRRRGRGGGRARRRNRRHRARHGPRGHHGRPCSRRRWRARSGPRSRDCSPNCTPSAGSGLRLGAGVDRAVRPATGTVTGVRLDTGEVLPADVVVVAIGADPATEWLAGSGLRVDNGLVCDSRCRAAEGIYAVGDVARWHHDRLGVSLRLENRTNAIEQADTVAANILGDDQPYRPGALLLDRPVRRQDPGARRAARRRRGDRSGRRPGEPPLRRSLPPRRQVTGVLGWNMPKQTRLRRQEVVDAFPDLTPALR